MVEGAAPGVPFRLRSLSLHGHLLGPAGAAVATLGEAVERGFAQVERLAEADEFRELATRADFRALVERTAPAGG